MNSKRLCFVLLAVVALLALTSLTEAKGKVERKKLNQARCGACIVVMKNLESVRNNGKMITNKSPYGYSRETLISEALTHVCGVSTEHLNTLGLDGDAALEACYDVVTQYDEELEELFTGEGVNNPKQACFTSVPVCKGLTPEEIIEPHDNFQKPRHPWDREGASQRLPE